MYGGKFRNTSLTSWQETVAVAGLSLNAAVMYLLSCWPRGLRRREIEQRPAQGHLLGGSAAANKKVSSDATFLLAALRVPKESG